MDIESRRVGRLGLTRFSLVITILCVLLLVGGAASFFFVEDHATNSRIAFQMFETFLMIVVIFIPPLLNRAVHIKVPAVMDIMFVAFCFCSLILGDVADFYGKFAWWDNMQHGLSGILLGILGYDIINLFNRQDGLRFRFPPLMVFMWVVCFALAMGACWEIMEFITDGLFGLNSQQFLVGSGTFDATEPLVGHEALRDTMEDLMLDLGGSLLIAAVGFFYLRRKR